MIRIDGARAIVTDIEGTTSSIAFVHEVLFPYARAHLPAFVDDPAEVAELRRWIDEDRKTPSLKALQGRIWRRGYESGELVAHVYDDAVRGLRAWRAAGVRLHVYSSGSAAAQKLLFGHSLAGDLTPLFERYFDTGVGPKTSADSYGRIAAELGLEPGAILFLSDAAAEIEAARAGGLQAVRIVRDGPAGPGEATRFDQIDVT